MLHRNVTPPAETINEELTLDVEKLVYGGDGLARNDRHVVFLPQVLPGEQVRARLTEKRSQLARAEAIEILRPSEERIAPPCPHFGECGGCHYQHARYGYQTSQKVEILREVLKRVGKLDSPEEIKVITGPEFGYRNRAQFHFDGGAIGYHEEGSRSVAAIENCAVLSPKLQESLAALKRMMKDKRFPNFLRVMELFTNETEVQLNVLRADKPVARRFFDWCAEEIPGMVPGPLNYSAAGFEFRVSHNAFFQVNRFLVDALVEESLSGAEGESAIDLYSGVGLFALPLAKRFPNTGAVESGTMAWRDLQHNATQAKMAVRCHQASAEDFLAGSDASADFILADPPRSGLGKHAVSRLLVARPRQLTLVSCNPATMARDLAALLPAYELTSMVMLDLFPQTYHLETVVRLSLR
ncbi:MAG: class I SAM-dependent RNA methyltransferase [Candidatus Solibacter usitatus]|nr:class I SAM-dependent RNA methyltransferase [Candidatus Solibacter usitatus]